MERKKRVTTVEVIGTIFPNDYKIMRRIDEDGVITYEHPIGPLVETYDEPLEMIISGGLERFVDLIEMLNGEDGKAGRFCRLFRVLVEDLETQLYEIFMFMDKTIGKITCTRIDKGDDAYRRHRCIGVSVTPPKPGNKSALPLDCKIMRRIDEHTTIIQVEKYDEELEMIISGGLERFVDLIEMLNGENESRVGWLFQGLVEELKTQLYEIFVFVDKTIGKITCIQTEKRDDIYRRYRCVGLSLTPPQHDDEGQFFTIDPELLEVLKQIPPDKTDSLKCIAHHISRGKMFQWYPITNGARGGKRTEKMAGGYSPAVLAGCRL